jgi:hypothetical protein
LGIAAAGWYDCSAVLTFLLRTLASWTVRGSSGGNVLGPQNVEAHSKKFENL